MATRKVKVLVLFSGGLDSILAAKILLEQGAQVEAITFKSYFFGSELAQKAAKNLGIKIRVIDISKPQLKIVKRPRYGYGKNMNPCIDCHLLMLKTAKKIMEKENFDLIATGEVLGERPMSQNKQAMALIEKEAGLSGYLLRPLSAKLLKPTIAEKKGLIDRDKLLAIQGRSRKKQIELAKKYNINWYPSPAGGCLLTDPGFSQRLKGLLKNYPQAKETDINLLKIGRHFWYQSKNKETLAKIVVGRNQQENEQLKKMRQKKDILIELKDFSGPTTLIRLYKGKDLKQAIKLAQKLTKRYSTKAKKQKRVRFSYL